MLRRQPTLPSTLPALDGLPPDVIMELEKLESLAENELRTILLETVPVHTQKQISRLLQKQKDTSLTQREQSHLAQLEQQADIVMFRKASAAALLRSRGFELPTLEELQLQAAGKRKRK